MKEDKDSLLNALLWLQPLMLLLEALEVLGAPSLEEVLGHLLNQLPPVSSDFGGGVINFGWDSGRTKSQEVERCQDRKVIWMI